MITIVPETVPPGEMWIHVIGDQPDDLGRIAFLAFWRDDIRWRGGAFVAGQVFYAREPEFSRTRELQGMTIRYFDGERVTS